jgi:hypothetical protein
MARRLSSNESLIWSTRRRSCEGLVVAIVVTIRLSLVRLRRRSFPAQEDAQDEPVAFLVVKGMEESEGENLLVVSVYERESSDGSWSLGHGHPGLCRTASGTCISAR